MKKAKLFCALLLLAALLVPGLNASALGSAAPARDRVTDGAEIWSAAEEEEFRAAIAELTGNYETDVVLLSVRLLHDDSLGDRIYGSITEFADDFYDANGYGAGSDRSGIILVICMEPGNRQYHFSTTGREYEAYSSADVSYAEEEIEPFLIGGDYGGAARRFLELVKVHEEKGHFEAGNTKTESSNLLWTFGLALLVAWAVTSNMRRRMNPVQKAVTAQNYIVNGSYELRRYNEFYLGTTVTKRPRNQNQGRGGGHVGSSGIHHGGGGGRF